MMKRQNFLASSSLRARRLLHVVGGVGVRDDLAGAVGVEVVGHVIALRLHVRAHLVEGGGGDEVALAVHLPGDGGVPRVGAGTPSLVLTRLKLSCCCFLAHYHSRATTLMPQLRLEYASE